MQALLLFADKDSMWTDLPPVDIWFFVICALIVVAIVAIYYLIPVFNKKKYQEQRDNLAKREAAFKANRQTNTTQQTTEQTTSDTTKETSSEQITETAQVADTAEVDSQPNKDADV